jgi:hypothetical protein
MSDDLYRCRECGWTGPESDCPAWKLTGEPCCPQCMSLGPESMEKVAERESTSEEKGAES